MGQQSVWIMIALVLDAVIAVTGIIVGPGFNVSIQVLAVRLYAWTLRDGFRADFR